MITIDRERLASIQGNIAYTSCGREIPDVAAVVLATGFDSSKCLDFFPDNILSGLCFSPIHGDLPIAVEFHGTYSKEIPNLGFVGFYRSPYWGVMEMQARFLAALWSPGEKPAALTLALKNDTSAERTLSLRDQPRCSQFPMGDYPFLMDAFSKALSIQISPPAEDTGPSLPHNNKPLDFLLPSRYLSEEDSTEQRNMAETTHKQAQNTVLRGLTSPAFVARGIFRSLLGTWKLERDLTSRLASHPSGHFSGTARFELRKSCSSDDAFADTEAMEYLYIEEGQFKADNGLLFQATRRYVWRYDEGKDALSVWFVKPDDQKRADYLFHEIRLLEDEEGKDTVWRADAGHLCIDDFYNVEYEFGFKAVNLERWTAGYKVSGPSKDYTIRGVYTR